MFENDIDFGVYQQYHENGLVEYQCSYSNGTQVGPHLWYDEQGNPLEVDE